MAESLTKQKVWDLNIMYASYHFETGSRLVFKKEFRAWWKKYYSQQGSNVGYVKLKFPTKTNRTLKDVFVRKKLPQQMLAINAR
jgi:hypothetical protein